jgi:general secretion pathway protein I
MRQRGFTLLEVLVATMVMAIAVAGLLGALSSSMRNAARLTERERAALLAKQKMDELLISRQLPKIAPFEGLFDPAETGGLEAGWKARLSPFDTQMPPAPGQDFLERIELEVWWKTGDDVKRFSMDGYRKGILMPEDVVGIAR